MTRWTADWALDTGLFGWVGWAARNAEGELAWTAAWTFDRFFGTVTWPADDGPETVTRDRFFRKAATA